LRLFWLIISRNAGIGQLPLTRVAVRPDSVFALDSYVWSFIAVAEYIKGWCEDSAKSVWIILKVEIEVIGSEIHFVRNRFPGRRAEQSRLASNY
jgi:hypothetical protein